MKNIKYTVLALAAFGAVSLTGCNDDFLNQKNEQELGEGTYLLKEEDLAYYLNNLYDAYVRGHQNVNADGAVAPFGSAVNGSELIYGDMMSDNMVRAGGSAEARLKGTFTTPASGTAEGWNWMALKRVNYFLRNYKQAEGSVAKPEDLNKWAAEARFFRAWDYYRKVMAFGDVPWYETDLQTDSPELFKGRDKREDVMAKVLEDINYAVEWIQDAGKADANGRINRDMANFLKARICLFEGTFRKYHEELGLTGTANDWFEEAIKACEAIMATGSRYTLHNTTHIVDGEGKTVGGKYWSLFALNNMAISPEAILVRLYDGVNMGHSTMRYLTFNDNTLAGAKYGGVSKSMVDEYLCVDGLPIGNNYNTATDKYEGGSTMFKGYNGYWTELENRDPRLVQSVQAPGTFQLAAGDGFGKDAHDINLTKWGKRYPVIRYANSTTNWAGGRPGATVTGYLAAKHWYPNLTDFDAVTKGTQTATIFRLGEVYLMLAEALYERDGSISDADLDRTINKLRERAGFNFSTYPKSKLSNANVPTDDRLDNIYITKVGYAIDPMLREIRRERRVEMFKEGLRWEDLMRWKAGQLLTVPMRGMKFKGTVKETLYGAERSYDKSKPATDPLNGFVRMSTIANQDVFVDADGFLVGAPLDNNLGIGSGTLPWSDYRYYWPLPKDQLSLNENLVQNEDWEGVAK